MGCGVLWAVQGGAWWGMGSCSLQTRISEFLNWNYLHEVTFWKYTLSWFPQRTNRDIAALIKNPAHWKQARWRTCACGILQNRHVGCVFELFFNSGFTFQLKSSCSLLEIFSGFLVIRVRDQWRLGITTDFHVSHNTMTTLQKRSTHWELLRENPTIEKQAT